MQKNEGIHYRGDFINGNWIKPNSSDATWTISSPADLSDRIIQIESSYAHVSMACEAARDGFKKWRETTLDDRKHYLLRLKQIFLKRADQIAQLISREVGKPLWESKTEATALASKIDITLDHSLKLIAEEKVKEALPKVDGFIRYKPRGVMAVVGPFNFPVHLPNGHIIPALISGNTVIFKPSDKTPAVSQIYAECFAEAEFPNGVFNLLHGQGEVGRRLVQNEHVDGVLFTGSYDVGQKIKQDTMDHYWKILALEMGGKNTTVVWDDADLEKAVYETIVGAYMTTGQRCSCTSKIVLHSKIKHQFIENFHAMAKALKIDHWSKEAFMGPLIGSDAVERYLRFQEIATREGAECIMRGKSLSLDYSGHYVSPSIHLVSKLNRESFYQRNEIFGPNVAVYATDEFEEAMEIVNDAGYGLVMAIFSKNRALYEKAFVEAKVGLVNWNRTTNGSSSKLPFGGIRKSGNDRPSGHLALQYCTVPVASLEDLGEFDKSKMLTGLSYNYK